MPGSRHPLWLEWPREKLPGVIVEQTEDVVVVEVEVDAGTGTQEQSSKPKGIGKNIARDIRV